MLGIFRQLKDAAGAEISAYGITNGALTLSETFAPGGMDAIGVLVDPGNTSGGTSPTIAFTLQASPDGGTTWVPATAPDGSNTAVATAALAAGSPGMVWSLVPVVETGSSSDILYRFSVTYNNADNDFTAVSAWVVGRKLNQRVP